MCHAPGSRRGATGQSRLYNIIHHNNNNNNNNAHIVIIVNIAINNSNDSMIDEINGNKITTTNQNDNIDHDNTTLTDNITIYNTSHSKVSSYIIYQYYMCIYI